MGGLSSTLLFDLCEGIVWEGYLQHFSLICMKVLCGRVIFNTSL